GMVLVRDRRPEERHQAVARVLVHRAFEAVHALGEDMEEAVEDAVPLLGIDLARELHRALHVGEEDGHLLPLALESGARGQDLVGEMLRRVGARVRCSSGGGRERRAALPAELGAGTVAGAARRARGLERCTAFFTEGRVGEVLAVTLGTLHRDAWTLP